MRFNMFVALSHLWMIVQAQDSAVPIDPGHIPTAVTVTNIISDSPTSASVASVFAQTVLMPGTTLSQCGPSVTCQAKPELIEITTKYPGTIYVTNNHTTAYNTTVMNTYVDLQVKVESTTVAHEGICTTVKEVLINEPLVITVDRTVTTTDWYLDWTTTTSTTTTRVNVTERHACTSSMPARLPIASRGSSADTGNSSGTLPASTVTATIGDDISQPEASSVVSADDGEEL